MKTVLSISILIILCAGAYAQTDLPEVGKITDIRGKTRVYLAGDAQIIKSLTKELAKRKDLSLANKPEEADFFVEYRTINIKYVTSLNMPLETGQLDVYFFREKRKVIAWSEGDSKGSKPPAVSLLKKFLKAFDQK